MTPENQANPSDTIRFNDFVIERHQIEYHCLDTNRDFTLFEYKVQYQGTDEESHKLAQAINQAGDSTLAQILDKLSGKRVIDYGGVYDLNHIYGV